MSGRRWCVARALLLVVVVAPAASGQGSRAVPRSAAECPVVGGVAASVTVRDTAGGPSRDILRVERNTSIDTTFTFNVVERRWAPAELAASAAAGLADSVRGKWYLCAGAGVGLSRPTLVVRGARGQVRLRASLADLSRALGSRARQADPIRTPPRRS